MIEVVAEDYEQSTGYLTAYELGSDGWRTEFGPWPVFVGENGFVPPDQKREGDGRTPTGAYGFDFAFGVLEDPGVKLPVPAGHERRDRAGRRPHERRGTTSGPTRPRRRPVPIPSPCTTRPCTTTAP